MTTYTWLTIVGMLTGALGYTIYCLIQIQTEADKQISHNLDRLDLAEEQIEHYRNRVRHYKTLYEQSNECRQGGSK